MPMPITVPPTMAANSGSIRAISSPAPIASESPAIPAFTAIVFHMKPGPIAR